MRHALLILLATTALGCSALGLFDRDRLAPEDAATDPDAEPTEDPTEADAVDDPSDEDVEEDAEEEWDCTIDDHCDDDDPCTEDECVVHTCSNTPMDADNDTYAAAMVEGTDCGGTDCDDSLDSVHPGATEICGDGVDQDCDGGEYPVLMHTTPVRVSSYTAEQGYPTLAWSGSTYGAAWSERGCASGTADCPMYFQRIEGDGTLTGSNVWLGNTIHSGGTTSSSPHITWGSTDFAIVWMEDDSDFQTYFNRFDIDGSALASASEQEQGRWPILAWSGSEYGMTWTYGATSTAATRFKILSEDGTERTTWSTVDGGSGNNYEAKVAWTGSEYGVFWKHGASASDIHFIRVTTTGSTSPSVIFAVDTTGESMQPRPTWSGSEFGLGWSDDRHGSHQPYFERLGPTGTVIGTELRVSLHGGTGYLDSLVWTGSEYAVAWTESTTGLFRGYFNTIGPTGTISGTEMTLTGTTSNALGIFMIWTGSEIGLVYRDDEDGSHDIMFNRIGFCD